MFVDSYQMRDLMADPVIQAKLQYAAERGAATRCSPAATSSTTA
jgi:hypothetical protein